jgi:Spy/CpxP family protein refolding chaperone
MDHAMHAGPGRWWSDPRMAQELGLSSDQQHRMDDLFQEHRLKLIDLSAALQKQEAIMEPLLGSDHPEESKILVQIDRIAQARAELEKANARLLLGLRGVLTQEQWKKLEATRTHAPGPHPPDRGDGPGPGHPGGAPPQPR